MAARPAGAAEPKGVAPACIADARRIGADRLPSGAQILRQRAWQMRDQIGADRLPPVPHDSEAIIMWLLETQVAISRIVGPELSVFDFGFPKHGLPTTEGYFGAGAPSPPQAISRAHHPT